jgi:hypothetical protein
MAITDGTKPEKHNNIFKALLFLSMSFSKYFFASNSCVIGTLSFNIPG